MDLLFPEVVLHYTRVNTVMLPYLPVYNAHFISREIDLQMYDAHNTRIPLSGQENKRRQKLCSNWCLINLVKIVHEVIVRRKIL